MKNQEKTKSEAQHYGGRVDRVHFMKKIAIYVKILERNTLGFFSSGTLSLDL